MSTLPARLPIILPIDQDAAAAITIRNGKAAAPVAFSLAMTQSPAMAATTPAICAPRGRSPIAIHANRTVKTTCVCINSDDRPAGMPSRMAMNNSENCATPIASP